ncbi:MAG: ATP-binding cassette domain-containing protein, partial [Pantoea sp.]|nr:ATP-binding cassette domain-containing protein [Pantoea sp.]
DKGWDARKRAYCLKIQPATGSFARNLIYSTKPRALPACYQTRCVNSGANFSGGQRQRIALARALISCAPVLLLDETSAGLDSENERHILKALREMPAERTVIMIAHRVSMLKSADRILLLEDGRIVETGDHTTLVEADGRYACLIDASQSLR